MIIAPALPDHALETVAGWLEIDVVDRHQALGDALLTARVFLRLLPLLRDRGIRTLAEAERASRDIISRSTSEAEAGWHEAVRAATLAGAQALRRDDIGRLAPGSAGHAVILDAPSHHHLAYRPGVPLVRDTIGPLGSFTE